MSLVKKLIESWLNTSGNVNTTEEILSWINSLNESTYVNINECCFSEDSFWFFDAKIGEIRNQKSSFFSIKGIRETADNGIVIEQPIILQPEIGYLGIICKEINGVLNFLMQAKI